MAFTRWMNAVFERTLEASDSMKRSRSLAKLDSLEDT
jgi:hypothetical protein